MTPARVGVADLLDAVAALVSQGVAPAAAARSVAAVLGPRSPAARAVGAALGDLGVADLSEAAALAARQPGLVSEDRVALGWLAQALAVAEPLGLPVREVVLGVAEQVRASEEDRLEADAAAAGPRATALVLTAMPGAALALGTALGADPWSALVGTTAGRGCLVVGLSAWLVGRWWIRRLVAGALAVGERR